MDYEKGTVLAVDDETFNLEILVEYLEEEGYGCISARDGAEAVAQLDKEPERFDAVLLDRMMPKMDGMEVLTWIKNHAHLSTLPVIMQTAKATKEDMLDGLRAGASYYLCKPFDRETLIAIVNTAVGDYQNYRTLQEQTMSTVRTLKLLKRGQFMFRTFEEGRNLAMLLANASSIGQRLVIGLSELFVNAVEHGNLGIGYEEKSRLNTRGEWEAEIRNRQAMAEYEDRYVTVEYTSGEDELSFLIRDQGNGFDWKGYLEISPDRAFDNHGRGIAMARSLSFDSLEYRGNGNEVLAVVRSG